MIKLLCIGDVVGSEGVSYFENNIKELIGKYSADAVIVNGENSADGNGISRASAERLYDAGADVITGGNHTFRQRDVYSLLDDAEYLVRPANYPPEAPGMGYLIADVKGYKMLVINVLGCVYMDPMNPPHDTVERILRAEKGRYDFAVCDIHAEATSEKLFFARYFDGRIAAVFGTHTHVQTADAQVLPGGTGYITDAGMCGSHNGILGVKTESIIHKFTVKTPIRFEPASGGTKMCGVYFEIDEKTGKCTKATRVEA
ncbi:MAG: TIGR00282 family metallophosphoesterase [Ruminococcaceae bacterium]|nr:TIGR00282 family metallophosphoesterase [Oscillospiraceae bacterium]